VRQAARLAEGERARPAGGALQRRVERVVLRRVLTEERELPGDGSRLGHLSVVVWVYARLHRVVPAVLEPRHHAAPDGIGLRLEVVTHAEELRLARPCDDLGRVLFHGYTVASDLRQQRLDHLLEVGAQEELELL